ncbi:MAG: NADH-quinone oxidoreductase subunit C, partial [Opitutales bacterium]|nr:NADH-quinone oxidoreductase subunit C [Opitutales bacterium]
LRKDFPLAGIEVPHPDPDTVAQTGVKVLPAPMNGGPFVSCRGNTMRETEPRALDQEWSEGNRKPAAE